MYSFIKSYYDLIENLNLKLLEDDSLQLFLLSSFVCFLIRCIEGMGISVTMVCFVCCAACLSVFIICLFAKVIDKKKSKVRLAVITLCHRLAHIVSQTHLVCLYISKGVDRNSYKQVRKKNIIISNFFWRVTKFAKQEKICTYFFCDLTIFLHQTLPDLIYAY